VRAGDARRHRADDGRLRVLRGRRGRGERRRLRDGRRRGRART
jgi:hypothetical protein